MKLISKIFPNFYQPSISRNVLNQIMEMHGVFSDVIPKGPKSFLDVICGDGTHLIPGSEILPIQLEKEPTLKWNAERNSYYFLCMLDPDMPSRKNPLLRNWQNWLVGNIPGCNVKEGDTYTEYSKPYPQEHTGLHRYIFIIYRQPEQIKFPFQQLSEPTLKRRGNFNIAEVARKYKFNDPIAGNFVHMKYDMYLASTDVPMFK